MEEKTYVIKLDADEALEELGELVETTKRIKANMREIIDLQKQIKLEGDNKD